MGFSNSKEESLKKDETIVVEVTDEKKVSFKEEKLEEKFPLTPYPKKSNKKNGFFDRIDEHHIDLLQTSPDDKMSM